MYGVVGWLAAALAVGIGIGTSGCTALFGRKYTEGKPYRVVVECVARKDPTPRAFRYRIAPESASLENTAVVIPGTVTGQGQVMRWAEYTLSDYYRRLRADLLEAVFDPDGFTITTHCVDVPLGATSRSQSDKYDRREAESLFTAQGGEIPETGTEWIDISNRILPSQPLRWILRAGQSTRSGQVEIDLGTPSATGNFCVRLDPDTSEWALLSRQGEYELILNIDGTEQQVTLSRALLSAAAGRD